MTQTAYQPEERERQRRLLYDQAIKLALESKWEEAVDANQRLLVLAPRDLSTLNRLGKALSEVGRYSEARQAYTEALEIDPTNNIARKNIDRLSQLDESEPTNRAKHERIDPRIFIEETGKTGYTNLIDLAPRAVRARLTAGDQVYLEREGVALYVRNANGDRIGRIEPRLASRLIKFMDSGNQYAAGITELGDKEVRLIVRETFQHPDMFGKVSFPAKGGETVRGYTRDSLIHYGADEGDEDEDEDEEGEEEAAEPEFEEPEFREPEE